MNGHNWGIIATSGIASIMANNIASVNGVPPLAVASRDIDRAKAFAEKHGISRAYGSYEELAKDNDIDIVYIATPMSCHFDNAMLCLTHNKSVLCEKAVTLNAKELELLIAEAEKRGLLFAEAMWTKALPSYLKGIEWVKEGRIGDIRIFKADFLTNLTCFNPDHRLFSADLGGGAILDIGSYAFNFVCGFMGTTPDEIRSKGHIGVTGVDFDSVTELVYGDASAYITLGFDMEGKSTANIIGTKGSIFFDANFPHTPHVKLKDENNAVIEEIDYKFGLDGFKYQIVEIESALSEKRISSRLIPYEESLAVMKIMDECRRQWGFKFPNE